MAPTPMRLPEKVFFQPELAPKILRFQFIYSMTGLALGLSCTLLGALLFVHGVAGSASWVVQLLGLKSSLSDARPVRSYSWSGFW